MVAFSFVRHSQRDKIEINPKNNPSRYHRKRDNYWGFTELEGFEPSNAGYGLRGLEVIKEV